MLSRNMYFTKDKNYIKEKYLVILRQTLNIIFFAGNSTNVEDRLSDKESERARNLLVRLSHNGLSFEKATHPLPPPFLHLSLYFVLDGGKVSL